MAQVNLGNQERITVHYIINYNNPRIPQIMAEYFLHRNKIWIYSIINLTECVF
jgi:hypothetical protein